jgi:predicted nucleotidyltransferase
MNKNLKKFLSNFKEDHPHCTILFLYISGSHFFNLNSPNSDIDFRAIYLPSSEDFYMKNKKETHKILTYTTNDTGQNNNDDVDLAITSLPRFLELLRDGDFNMMETLFCPEDKIIIDTPIMKEIRNFKHNILVKDASSFLGFFRKEYKKYGININHHSYRCDFLKFVKSLSLKRGIRLEDHWDSIVDYQKKNSSHFTLTKTKTGSNNYIKTINIGNRLYQCRKKITYVIEQLELSLKKAGHRQKKMAETGKEFKGLYHAQRLLFEATELLTNGTISIPLKKEHHDLLRKIKDSNIEQDVLFAYIEDSLSNLELIEQSLSINNDLIKYKIDKIIFTLENRLALSYLINKKP